MKKLTIIATVVLASLQLSVAGATTRPASNTLDVQEVRASTLLSGSAIRSAFRELRGSYAMEDGSVRWVYADGDRYVAEISGAAPIEVRVVSNNRLIAVTGNTELTFKQNAAGYYADVVLTKA